MIYKAQTLASMLPISSCPERNLRSERYDDAVRAYRIAVVLLDAALPLQDFDAAYRLSEKARKVLERSRQEFEAHVAAHSRYPRNL
jgi:hypothetical protein